MPEMERIANYIILKTISQKGPSSVYLARHATLERKTLLKVYRGGDKNLIDRFEREAKIVADLNSGWIVEIYDFGQSDDQFFISMEYVDGSDLEAYLQTHSPGNDEVIDFAYRISHAVSILHNKGYIHRDLKPENILVARDKKIKLTDFGLTLHESLNRITSEGSLLGTPLYMSPEQINNSEVTQASDIFALGIIFYRMASGSHPFQAPQYSEVFSKILTYDPPSLKSIRPDLPGWFVDLIDRALQKDVKKRIQNAGELLKIFETHLNRSPSADQNHPGNQPNSSPSGKRILITAAVLVAVLLTLFYVRQQIIRSPAPNLADSLTINRPDSRTKPDSNEASRLITANNHSAKPTMDQPGVSPDHQQPLNNQESLPTTFLVESYPWCTVYLNYKKIDQTPMAHPYPIKPGKYLLGLQNPAFPSFADSVTILPHQNNVFTYHMDSLFTLINLDVHPWGDVYIDGKHIGTTPLQKKLYVTRDLHTIKIKNNFYGTIIDTVDARKQRTIHKFFEFHEKK